MRLHSLRYVGWVGAIATLGLVTACNGTAATSSQATIDSQGGSIGLETTGSRGAVSIVVPPGALATATTITLREGSDPTDLPDDAGGAAGPLVVFGPEGQHFAQAVAITLPTTDTAETIYTRPVGGTTWTEVEDAQFDAANHRITGHVNHFSEFVPGRHHHRLACAADADCGGGSVCVAGVCSATGGTDASVVQDASVEACNANADCSAGHICVGGACRVGVIDDAGAGGRDASVNECNEDTDCSAGHICVGGACRVGVIDDAGAGGRDASAGLACNEDSDCGAGHVCVSGSCR